MSPTTYPARPDAVSAEPNSQQRLADLVSGIMADVQTLLSQQVQMLSSEVREDVRRTQEAAKYLGIGTALLGLGGLFLAISGVQLLAWLAPSLPMWGCWALVGGGFALSGAAALFAGKTLFDSFNPLPDKTANALTENLSWLTNRRN